MIYDSNSIKQNLLKIKHSQEALLEELKTEHNVLQGYVHDKSQSNQKLLDNSLQFSKSDCRESDLQPMIENKYKKIQQLLLKERKLQEESHALQTQNQSLICDYRQLKKLYQKQKQQSTSLEKQYTVLGQFYHLLLTKILLGVSHEQIISQLSLKWHQHQKQYPSIDGQWVRKSFQLLSQGYKVSPEHQKTRQLQSVKNELKTLMTMKKQNQNKLSSEYEYKLTIHQSTIAQMKAIQSEADRKIKMLQNEVSSENGKLKSLTDEVTLLRLAVKQKQQILLSQSQLHKKHKQNQQKMQKDLQQLSSQNNNLKQLLAQKQEQLKSQSSGLTLEHNRQKLASQRQIHSLNEYISTLKLQYDKLLKSEQMVRNNEHKYKELLSKQNAQMKLNVSIDHLWQVKEIEYNNIMNLLRNGL